MKYRVGTRGNSDLLLVRNKASVHKSLSKGASRIERAHLTSKESLEASYRRTINRKSAISNDAQKRET